MANKYVQNPVVNSTTRFSAAPMSDLEFSRMTAAPVHITTLNAGDIVPIYCREILPHESMAVSVDMVIRQTTVSTPTFGNMECDLYAFFVPNRIVNESWKNVMGENTSGAWVAPEVSLVPLYTTRAGAEDVQVPVGSVADYYGFPTQAKMPAEVLQSCHDLKFRGYLEIYNTRFRDQNYQPPIPYSKLNVYEGFFEEKGSDIPFSVSGNFGSSSNVVGGQGSDGSDFAGAVQLALYGEGSKSPSQGYPIRSRVTNWSALDKPLKANKLHDYFTSVLPSSQKGPEVIFNLGGSVPVSFGFGSTVKDYGGSSLKISSRDGLFTAGQNSALFASASTANTAEVLVYGSPLSGVSDANSPIFGTNLTGTVDLGQVTALSLSDLRDAAAIKQVYEILSRSGSRYREFVNSFFGLDVDDPFCDIPRYLGHIRRELDLYQTAQTSPSAEGSTPQGNLAAFGYTATGGALFHASFVEHGYVHVFAVIRHRNLYASFLSRDNFRLNAIDFYTPPLANISEQPVYTREINPFASDLEGVFGYQEAWSEYRYEPDMVSGYMRPGIKQSLSIWNYADDFDSNLTIADDDWLKSNSQDVLDRTLAVTSEQAPQFKALFRFTVDKELPMPTYSVPGLDII